MQTLWQISVETRCDVAILSDHYRIQSEDVRWVADKDGSTAIVATGKYPIHEMVSNSCEGFVITKVNGVSSSFFQATVTSGSTASSAPCPECGLAEQTAEHIIFDCSWFEEPRSTRGSESPPYRGQPGR